MKLTKDAQRVWDQFKREGLTDEEIFERVPVWPHEYESEEEKKEVEEEFRKFREASQAKMSQEDRDKIEKLRERFLEEDRKKNESR